MTRHDYLTRLALGRSAFEPIDETQDPQVATELSENGGRHAQQYDARGRPVNPRIEAFNAEMRTAQNDVLALVGVVERKDLSDRVEERRNRYIRERRARLLNDEQEKGELLDYAFMPVVHLSHMWTDAFIQRIQIGFYDSSRSVAEILIAEWQVIFSGGLKNALASIFPGFGELILHTVVRLPLIVCVEQMTGRLQNYVQKQRFKRKTANRLYTGISVLFEVALLGIDMMLLPMEFHARVQRLGLAPPLPLFPSWKSFLPWHPTSFQQFGWRPLFGIMAFKTLTSPAMLLLLQKVLHWDSEESEIPICGLFTSYRYPPIDQDPGFAPEPNLGDDTMGWIMYKAWSMRQRFMKWCGWDLYQIVPRKSPDGGGLENNTRQCYEAEEGHSMDLVPTHRSTALAQLPAQRLAASIDGFLARLITLPYESLMLRAVAHSFLVYSTTPKTTATFKASSRLYPPFQGSPVTQLLRTPSNPLVCTSAGTYISRLGLALALDASVDVFLFFGVYTSTRHIGRKYFSWRPRGPVQRRRRRRPSN